MNKISKLILAGALVLGIGCGGEEAPAAPAAAAPAAAAPAAAAPAPAAAAPAAGGGGGSVCERAASCCVGYIEAMVAISPAVGASLNAETTCAGVRQAGAAGAAAEPGCQAAIDGWRQGLAAMPGATVPAACQ